MGANMMTAKRWTALNKLSDGRPHTDLADTNVKVLQSLQRAGFVVGHFGAGERWAAITPAGKAEIARVEAAQVRPAYAGGPGTRAGRGAGLKNRQHIFEPTATPTVPAPATCIALAEVEVELRTRVVIPLGAPADAQAIKQLVEQTIQREGVGLLIQGWRVVAVLDEKHNMLVGPSHG